MDDAGFGTITGINPDGTANFGDRNPFVSFFRGTRLNQTKTVAAGVPVYDPVDMIKIIKPGERDEIHRIADEYDKMRYRNEWKGYCEGIEQQMSGTPLETLLPVNPELVAQLKAFKVFSVQQLAELSDTAAQSIQFGHDLRKKAQKYLAVAEKGTEYHRFERELEAKDAEIKDIRGKLALLEERMRLEALRSQERHVPEPGSYVPPEPTAGFSPAIQTHSDSPIPPPIFSGADDAFVASQTSSASDGEPMKRGPGRPRKGD